MNNPEYIEVKGKKYKINTDFRVALRCNEISMRDDVGDLEKIKAMIYLLFGKEALYDEENYEEILDLLFKYLSCNDDKDEEDDDKEPDMDYIQDYSLIKASFMSDYKIDLNNIQMHWWDFYAYINGLTSDCILNRVREIRTCDISDYEDEKSRKQILKQKEHFKLKTKEIKATNEQQKNVNTFYELTGIKRKE